jgi:hypothetical protein
MKHKHYDLIVAWAGGARIEVREPNGDWTPMPTPSWFEHNQYRVVPEPKPDYVRFAKAQGIYRMQRDIDDNVRLTYDGETGKLKSVEVLE